MTLIEAIACGTPVICSSMIAYKEFLHDNAIFVHPRNPQQLTGEIVNLLEDEVKKIELVDKTLQFIKRYTWNSVGKKLEKIYHKFLSK